MKRTVRLFAFLLVLFLIFPTALLAAGLWSPARYDGTFVGALSVKMDRLQEIRQPKVIVVGGSSVAFGLRSDLLEREIGRPVVNFGLYASLGTKIMLELSKANIAQGDIILIAPEQDAQTLSTYFNADTAWRAIDGHPGYLRYLDGQDLREMAGAYLSFTAEKFRYAEKGSKPAVSGVYCAESFNDYGDIAYERPVNTMFAGFDANTPIRFEPEMISQEFAEYLNRYAAEAEKRGATVYFAFSPMNAAALPEGTEEGTIYAYYTHLCRMLHFPVLGDPNRYIMESGWFYDSNFHMNDAGAVAHTAHLAQDLKLALGDLSPVGFEVPEMPALPEPGEGPSVEDELFLLSGTGSGLEITGLTEKAKQMTEITVPSRIGGVSVNAVAAGAFSEGVLLERIEIMDGLTYLANGAFEGCENLKEIRMNCKDPAQVRVGEELLSGAENCVIVVPEDLFDAYANDYYWAAIYDQGLIVSAGN